MTLMKVIVGLLITMILVCGSVVWAQYSNALLVLDMRNEATLPKHFRSTDSLPLDNTIDQTGLSELHMAGSAQFSKLALEKVLQHLHVKHLTIIDLRQESHGFLNGNAISWYGWHNAANASKTPAQIEKDQAQKLNELGKLITVKVAKIIKKTPNDAIDKTQNIEFNVRTVSTEAELANDLHLNYRHISVQDFHAPTSKEVDQFIRITKTLPKDQWIYFHCRGGAGRTATFMVMYDMMHHAKQISFNMILARQKAMGGKDLQALPSKDNWKYPYAVMRLNFLKNFYEYCNKNNDNFETTWTAWLKANRKKINT